MSLKHNRTLIEMITTVAKEHWKEDITAENFDAWRLHWIQVGEGLAMSFEIEGLLLSAKALWSHVNWEKGLVK